MADIIVVIYILITIVLGVMIFAFADYLPMYKRIVVAIFFMLLGPIISAFLFLLAEEKFENMVRFGKKAMDIPIQLNIFKFEKTIVAEDTWLLTASGQKIPITGEFKKEIGLITNKYIQKELDKRYNF